VYNGKKQAQNAVASDAAASIEVRPQRIRWYLWKTP